MRWFGLIVASTLLSPLTCHVQSAEVVRVGEQIRAGAAGDAKLSADGNTVTGRLNASPSIPFIWTRESGRQLLGPFPDGQQVDGSSGISADGSTVVGTYGPTGRAPCLMPYEAFTWSAERGVTLLPHPANVFSLWSQAISDDGETVVGHTISDVVSCVNNGTIKEYKDTAFKWTKLGGLTTLAFPDSFSESLARDVSADGSVIVGVGKSLGFDGDASFEAVMWNDAGVHTLGPLPEDWRHAGAYLVSADGLTVVGSSEPGFAIADAWFRWTDAGGFMELPKLSPDQRGAPKAVSVDGSVILGAFLNSSNDVTSVVWDERHGTRNLWNVLVDEHGVTRDELGDLSVVADLSADTTTLLAYEWSLANQSWVAYSVIYLDKPLVSPWGDFDDDHYRTATDIDLLSDAIRTGSTDLLFDVNKDSAVDAADRDHWVHQLINTYVGDANLDGEFNSKDFTTVFLAGEYEDAIEDNSGWAEGDWDGDGDFTSGDFVVAFLDGGYEKGPRIVTVPEPTSMAIVITALIGIAMCRRMIPVPRSVG